MSNLDFKDNVICNVLLQSLFEKKTSILNCIFKLFYLLLHLLLNNLTNMWVFLFFFEK
jgi:hypothetical protein